MTAQAGAFADAYATVLSLDSSSPPTPASAPVRLAILDVNDDGAFDATDVTEFMARYATPTQLDYSRWDLNGDGNTGDNQVERFDLDRVGSTQYGETSYSTVTQVIEGVEVSFPEEVLIQITGGHVGVVNVGGGQRMTLAVRGPLDGVNISNTTDSTIELDGISSAGISVRGNTNLSLGALSAADMEQILVELNVFRSFGAFTGATSWQPMSSPETSRSGTIATFRWRQSTSATSAAT